jgi:hypothetical protein
MFTDAPSSSQLILGIDKRNPLFALYEDFDQEQLHVYYGFELLEIVPNQTQAPAFKLLGGRLFNAGLKVQSLTEVFEVDRKTLQRWGRALQSGDAQELKAGTGPVESEDDPEERGGTAKSASPVADGLMAAALAAEKRETPCDCEGGEPEGGCPSNSLAINTRSLDGLQTHNPKESPVLLGSTPGQSVWCEHAGVLLFARALNQVSAVVEPPQPLLRQGSATLLLGALNIEPTKFLNWQDLELLLGTVVRFPAPQRDLLKSVAAEATVAAVFRFHAQGLSPGSDLYFDPHTEHYTGQQNVLKGWCPAVRLADQALHSDFIHTHRGEPLYFETTDNFEDLRQRFFAVLTRCRKVLNWPAERVLTAVVDRGILGAEVFEKVLADPALHLITWQKGYGAQSWDPKAVQGQWVMERARNAASDLRSYHFEYLERDWPTDPRLRQIVVQATNPQGRVVQVAILTDDRARAAAEGIGLIFNRWIQENDFKYLDKHYGINQLTSYRVIP